MTKSTTMNHHSGDTAEDIFENPAITWRASYVRRLLAEHGIAFKDLIEAHGDRPEYSAAMVLAWMGY